MGNQVEAALAQGDVDGSARRQNLAFGFEQFVDLFLDFVRKHGVDPFVDTVGHWALRPYPSTTTRQVPGAVTHHKRHYFNK
ncbi:hypothetical protein [uncultured Pseudomonas sp.]|uniref:hypothetical protein n=1 Tax=uncultured Pseudomonas sp. TaxID=114707 RepID=UPI002597C3D0|nr:hypothetical protein [uncultured Pseudomonas sp.]